MKKENEFSCLFGHNIISNGLYQAIRQKTTELVLLFHKNITKLVFLCPKMGQKCFKVLIFSNIIIIFLLRCTPFFVYFIKFRAYVCLCFERFFLIISSKCYIFLDSWNFKLNLLFFQLFLIGFKYDHFVGISKTPILLNLNNLRFFSFLFRNVVLLFF